MWLSYETSDKMLNDSVFKMKKNLGPWRHGALDLGVTSLCGCYTTEHCCGCAVRPGRSFERVPDSYAELPQRRRSCRWRLLLHGRPERRCQRPLYGLVSDFFPYLSEPLHGQYRARSAVHFRPACHRRSQQRLDRLPTRRGCQCGSLCWH